jgi:hypothetical protein
MVFTPDGKYLLAAARAAGWNYDTAFRVWHVPTGELKQALGGWNMQTVAVHPRGNIMVVADNTWWYIKAIRLWQAFTPDDSRQQTGSAVFKGKFGYTYRFYALGEDKVGNRRRCRQSRRPPRRRALRQNCLPVCVLSPYP